MYQSFVVDKSWGLVETWTNDQYLSRHPTNLRDFYFVTKSNYVPSADTVVAY